MQKTSVFLCASEALNDSSRSLHYSEKGSPEARKECVSLQ